MPAGGGEPGEERLGRRGEHAYAPADAVRSRGGGGGTGRRHATRSHWFIGRQKHATRRSLVPELPLLVGLGEDMFLQTATQWLVLHFFSQHGFDGTFISCRIKIEVAKTFQPKHRQFYQFPQFRLTVNCFGFTAILLERGFIGLANIVILDRLRRYSGKGLNSGGGQINERYVVAVQVTVDLTLENDAEFDEETERADRFDV